jgi:hypothetical protein
LQALNMEDGHEPKDAAGKRNRFCPRAYRRNTALQPILDFKTRAVLATAGG